MPEQNDITVFAKTSFRNREVAFGIRRDDRRRHMYVIGKTGMGKTTLIENMVIQDILNGEGVAFVDPHGDSVEKVLDYIPANRINDVIYFNPADTDFPIAFNPLEAVDPKYKHLVASGLMGVFTKIWAGVWSPRMEYILNNTILALLDSPGNTMLGIARMLVNKTYRKKIIDNIKDPVVRSFWIDEFANYSDKFRTEAIAPIQNKVGQFLSSAIIRNIVGQTKSTIELRDIMDKRKIFLLNLSKGRIGEDSSALLGAMIITKLQLAAMSRVDIPEQDRLDFYLYVDEFQNFATESFASILSEARKYRLNLIVAHQYINQLSNDKNTVVRDAIFGNVGTLIVFRVGADDAEFLETEFEPTYTPNDLLNLSKYNIYLKLMINGVASAPFSALTLAPISKPTDNEDKVIKVSRERYGTSRQIVEEKIHKWLGSEYHAEAARAESASMDEPDAEEHFRYKENVKIENATGQPVAEPVNIPQQSSPSASSVPPPTPVPAPVVEKKIEQPKPQPKQERGPERQERSSSSSGNRETPRRELDRRTKQLPNHPNRRSSDRAYLQDKPKPKAENPVWDTVNKLSQDKLKEQVQKTTNALESISKTLEQSLKPKAAIDKHWEPTPEPIPTPQEEIELEDQDPFPPGGNPQSHLTMIQHKEHPAVTEALKNAKLSKIKPGDKIKL